MARGRESIYHAHNWSVVTAFNEYNFQVFIKFLMRPKARNNFCEAHLHLTTAKYPVIRLLTRMLNKDIENMIQITL